MDLRTHEGILEAAQLVVDIIQDDATVKQQLAAVGFGTTQYQNGKKFVQSVESHLDARLRLEQERWALAQQINAGLDAVRDEFRHHVKAARFALQDDPERLHALSVDQMIDTTWGGVKQAIHFYKQLQQQEVSLEAFGVSAKVVQESLKTATQLLKSRKVRTHKKGLAQQNTQEVRQAITVLRRWVMEFRASARLAYRSQPQMLEMFGIRVKSTV